VGVEVGIISGRPTLEDSRLRRQEESAARERSLREKTKMLGVSQSPAARMVADLIEERLIDRIEKVLMADPESKAYLDILRSISSAEGMAQRAFDELVKKKILNIE